MIGAFKGDDTPFLRSQHRGFEAPSTTINLNCKIVLAVLPFLQRSKVILLSSRANSAFNA
jgi:hypothetical protein